MPLTPGTRLGAYEILAPLGAGGMGEVYRARDTRLDRDVAIKVLPSHLSADEAARARFEREAKAVAALSHPNILAVHDFGSHEGLAFVVMELLEGQTLRDRLTAAAGPLALPIRKVTQIGMAIAQGLAAAHDKHIVHRDLKPENVFLTADGHVKILDFGLARQLAPPAANTTDAATALQHTDPGTVMGTMGYMAPEQVKGLPADHRADVFALGCLLYEMASGRRAFQRATAAETMSAVLRDEPPDLVSDSGAVPEAFAPIVRHCLEKSPDERFQSARDLAFALQSIGAAPAASGSVAVLPVPASPARKSRGRTPLVAAAAALAAVLLVALGRYTAKGGSPVATGPQVAEFQQLTDMPGVETAPTLSPDGKTIVYSSDVTGASQLYSLRVGSRQAVALTTDGVNTSPVFSPDGERIAFRSSRDGGGIFLMTASGESVTRVSDAGYMPSWSPDGSEIALAESTFQSPTDLGAPSRRMFAVDARSGRTRELLKADSVLQPAWSPNGFRIAYFGLRAGGQRDVWTVAADGSQVNGPAVDVTNDAALDWNPVWSPDGTSLYFSSNRGGTLNLWRVAIDERTGAVLGPPEPVTTPSVWSGMMSFSRDGTRLAFASLDWRSTLWRQGFDPVRETLTGAPVPMLKGSRPIRDHDISPDGRWVVFMENAAHEDLLVARTDGTEYRRLTDDAARDRAPVWLPDGSRIVFYSDRGGAYDLWFIRPDGSQLVQYTKVAGPNFPTLSPDGSRIAYSGLSARWFFVIDAASQGAGPFEPEPPINDRDQFWPFSWSRDGARIAGARRGADGNSYAVATYDLATRKYSEVKAALTPGWLLPIWLADSRRMLVRTNDGVWLVHADTGAIKRLVTVHGYAIGRSVGLAPDNTWFSYSETATEGAIWVAHLKK